MRRGCVRRLRQLPRKRRCANDRGLVVTIGQWLAVIVFTAWRYDTRGFYIDLRTRAEGELETRLWCFVNGIDPDRWLEWCDSDYEALPEVAS